jgi:hypothetical protein
MHPTVAKTADGTPGPQGANPNTKCFGKVQVLAAVNPALRQFNLPQQDRRICNISYYIGVLTFVKLLFAYVPSATVAIL